MIAPVWPVGHASVCVSGASGVQVAVVFEPVLHSGGRDGQLDCPRVLMHASICAHVCCWIVPPPLTFPVVPHVLLVVVHGPHVGPGHDETLVWMMVPARPSKHERVCVCGASGVQEVVDVDGVQVAY